MIGGDPMFVCKCWRREVGSWHTRMMLTDEAIKRHTHLLSASRSANWTVLGMEFCSGSIVIGALRNRCCKSLCRIGLLRLI